MFRLDDQQLVLSATDLTSYLACEHLIEQKRAVAGRERARWAKLEDPHGQLAKDRGITYEHEVLGRLSAQLGGHVDLTAPETRFTRAWHVEQAARTQAAMRAGAPLIYQALLFDGRWQGRVDFLRRVPVASALGPWSYEVLDTKLAREVKPYVVHQLALYTRLLGRGPGAHAAGRVPHPRGRHGAARRPAALRRPAPPRRPAARAARRGGRAADLPRADRALRPVRPRPRVPRPPARRRPPEPRRGRPARPARAPGRGRPAAGPRPRGRARGPGRRKLGTERFDLLRHQAALQVATWDDGGLHHRHLAPESDRGYARLPAPDAGDVFFDLEGDPYVGTDGGIEYLWGWCTADRAYRCVWAHDAAGEKAALEHFVDLVMARRRSHPGCTSSTTPPTRRPSCAPSR